ncbi:unnamed protein product [Ectocarpus sp. 6 AP-2014]
MMRASNVTARAPVLASWRGHGHKAGIMQKRKPQCSCALRCNVRSEKRRTHDACYGIEEGEKHS